MQNKTYKIANTLLTKLAAMEHVTVADYSDGDSIEYGITVDLGTGWAGDYAAASWGGWGDVSITDDRLELYTTVTNWYLQHDDEYDYNTDEGKVRLHYKDFETAGLAYTSELEDKINAAVEQRTGGLLLTDGSEQGMQGMDSADDCYLSLDVGVSKDLDESADTISAELRAEMKAAYDKLIAQHA